jgi:hypothetical protein
VCAENPPSTVSTVPDVYPDAAEARNAIAEAISQVDAARPKGRFAAIDDCIGLQPPKSLGRRGAGLTPTTRTPAVWLSLPNNMMNAGS